MVRFLFEASRITPQTTFNQLVVMTRISQQAENISRVAFFYEEMSMLKALKAGRDVILNGELSSLIYQQLLPLLSTTPVIFSNGEILDKTKITRKLTVVMPPSAKK